MPSERLFISHVSEEAEVAAELKRALARDFLGMLDVFVSSDGESIAAGENWVSAVDRALHESKLLIILCSPMSLHRPWVNFEAGVAWALDVPIIPLCHAGLRPRDLRMPLSLRQGLLLDDPRHIRQLYARITEIVQVPLTPERDFEELASGLGRVSASLRSTGEDELRRLEDDRGIGRRLLMGLSHPEHTWRTLDRVAVEAGVSQDVAADLLRANDDVRFGRGRNGETIVGLRSRVGDGRR